MRNLLFFLTTFLCFVACGPVISSAKLFARNANSLPNNTAEFLAKQYPENETTYEDQFCHRTLPANCTFLRDGCVRPSQFGVSVLVDIDFVPRKILGIDDVNQIFTISGFLKLEWQLPRCATWDSPSRSKAVVKEPIHFCMFSPQSIWTPRVRFARGSEEERTKEPRVKLMSSGTAMYSVLYDISSTCKLWLEKFPFDRQSCSVIAKAEVLEFFYFRSTGSDFYLSAKDTIFDGNPIWKWENWTIDISLTDLNVTFTVSRKWESYMGTIFLPTILLALLQLAALVMPPETTDRSSYSITGFVALAVFQGMSTSGLPRTSEVLFISIYYEVQMAVGVFITVYSLVICRCLATHSSVLTSNAKTLLCFGLNVRRVDLIDLAIFCISLSAYATVNVLYFLRGC